MELLLGAIAGALAQLLTLPVGVVATRQQLEVDHKGQTFMETIYDIIKEDGITGLWRGLKPSLALTVNPAITYGAFHASILICAQTCVGMFERLRVLLLGEDGKMSPGRAFYIGALSKTLATVVRLSLTLARKAQHFYRSPSLISWCARSPFSDTS